MDLGRAVSKLFASKALTAVLGFASLAYFAREITTAELGIYFLFQAVVGVLAILADCGFVGAALKRISEGEDEEAYFTTGLLIISSLSLFVAGVVFALEPFLSEYLGSDIAILVVLGVILSVSSRYFLGVLRAEQRVGETAKYEFIRTAIWVAGGVILIAGGATKLGLIYSQVFAFGVITVLVAFDTQTGLTTPTLAAAKSLYNYAKFGISAYLDSFLYNWLDVLLIGFFITQSAVAPYEIAWKIAAIVMLFSGAIERTITPQISRWDAENDIDSIEDLIPDAIFWSLFFTIPAFFGVLLLNGELLTYLFAPEYSTAAIPLVILMAGKVTEAIDRPLKQIVSGIDRPDLRMRAALASVSLNILLNVSLIPVVGITGAAIGTTVSFALSTILLYVWLQKEVSIQRPDEIGWLVASAVVMMLCLFIMQHVVEIQSMWMLLGQITIAAMIYIVAALTNSNVRQNAFHYASST